MKLKKGIIPVPVFLIVFLLLQSFLSRAAVFTVTTTADAGGGSLRQCMINANSTVGNDQIIFNLGAGGPFTITLLSALPTLTDNAGCTIDGFNNSGNNGSPNSQPIFSLSAGTPMNPVYMIVINTGALFPTVITCASTNNVIKGLVFMNWGDGTPSNNDVSITLSGNSNTVIGCYIGVDVTGTIAGTLASVGIMVTGRNNIIGDGTPAGANLLAGMFGYGYKIYLSGATATANIVKGNVIGLQPDGSSIITNSATGIQLSGPSNTIGGLNNGEGNLISGNWSTGMSVSSNSNVIIGNFIGPKSDGVTGIGAIQSNGMSMGGSYNQIGGSTVAHRNVIAGNTNLGMDMSGSNNIIRGNYWGTNKFGTARITVGNNGGFAMNSGTNNIVGGTGVGDGNLISGFPNMGIWMLQFGATNANIIQQNTIGLAANGTSSLTGGGSSTGILMGWNTSGNLIGGSTSAARNIISGNSTGISMGSGGPASNNTITGNYFGIAGDGISKVIGANQNYGVYMTYGVNNMIGNTGAGQGNIFSGMNSYGIYLSSASVTANSILQNTIGPQSNGTSTLLGGASFQQGIYVLNSPSNTIGGSTSAARNIISGNSGNAVYLDGAGTHHNKIQGNYLGPGAGGAAITGASQTRGVYIVNSASSNSIGGYMGSGGSTPQGNLIAYNTGDGIYILSLAADSNLISRNLIYSNGGASKAINLNYGASQGNNGKSVPTILSVSPTVISGTSTPGDSVEVFTNTTGNCRDLMVYKGTVLADPAGNWTLSGIVVNAGESAVATAREVNSNNTSEASICTVPLPVEMSFLEAVCDNKKVRVRWKTSSEKNCAFFTIERTHDGNEFEWVGRVKAKGNSDSENDYEILDQQPGDGMVYYRITQTDIDKKTTVYFTNVVYDCSILNLPVSLFPNPANTQLNIAVIGGKNETVKLRVLNGAGQEVLNGDFQFSNGVLSLPTENLAKGFYILLLDRGGEPESFRFVKE